MDTINNNKEDNLEDNINIYDKYFWLYICLINGKAINLTFMNIFAFLKFTGLIVSTFFYKLENYATKIDEFIEMEQQTNANFIKYSTSWKEYYTTIYDEMDQLHSKVSGVEKYVQGFLRSDTLARESVSKTEVKIETDLKNTTESSRSSELKFEQRTSSPTIHSKLTGDDALSSSEILEQLLEDAIVEMDEQNTLDDEVAEILKGKQNLLDDTIVSDPDDSSIEDVTEEEMEKRRINREVIEVD